MGRIHEIRNGKLQSKCPCCDRVGCALFQRLKKMHISPRAFAEELIQHHPDLCGACGRSVYCTPDARCRERSNHVPIV